LSISCIAQPAVIDALVPWLISSFAFIGRRFAREAAGSSLLVGYVAEILSLGGTPSVCLSTR
jgi:hypothetical protein